VALRRTDKLLGGYVALLSVSLLARPWTPRTGWLLALHGLFAVLLVLLAQLTPRQRFGTWVHDLYPLVMLVPFYTELGLINLDLGHSGVLAHDLVVQRWESAIFGGQVSYEWIRTFPSVFWSGVLHLAYFAYYPIVVLGPIALAFAGRRDGARDVLHATMLAFVTCYLVFLLYPVAGPYYAFDHPTGPVREVWSARLIYGILAGGSAFGTAFPSSHVAATTASTYAVVRHWRALGLTFVMPAVFLTIGTVYCQMHYAVDVVAGLVVAAGISVLVVNPCAGRGIATAT